jgi:DNA-binding transcriptional ArsR family regulator
MFGAIVCMPLISRFDVIPKGVFSFSNSDNRISQTDTRFKMILWLFIGGSRGGPNRARILNLVRDIPMNAHQISKSLNLDHKTVAHHLKILAKNNLLEKSEKSYGAEYQLSQIMNKNLNVLSEIMEKIATK